MYWNIPTLPLYDGQKDAFVLDSTFQTIKYYAIISAIQSKDNERTLKMIERAINEPFIENSTFEESALYELMATEYINMGDSANYQRALELGAQKFPQVTTLSRISRTSSFVVVRVIKPFNTLTRL